ncbi:hypothetical protein D9V37_13435 [Nocardioides mangrovicus]|uniref:GP-PDE domain-containing protein n=1 Tax=Nocardioides mangrovicus TaxID=2478913 RepID=A0A3L8NZW9_9ACTN|nr:hypothetical protein D9V37_13435 [Nocardioides mangrovicus]
MLAGFVGALLLAGLATVPAQADSGASERKHKLSVTFPHTMVRGQAAGLRVVERPIRRHRLLKVYYRPSTGGAWHLAAKERETKRGKARIRFALPATGSYTVRLAMARYRISKHRHVKLRQVYGSVKVVPTRVPVVMAHRGGGAEAPENTMAAFTHAIAVGAPTVETDVHETSDGHLILMHDSTLARTTNAEAYGIANTPVWQLRWDQIQQVQVDVGPGASQPVPQLSDLLALLQQNPGTRLLVEAKDPGSGQPDLYQKMLDAMNAAGIDSSRSGRAAIESFDVDGLKSFAIAHPGLNVSPIMQKRMTAPRYYTWAGSITLESRYATASQIALLHAGGLAVNVWTLDTAAQLAAAADAGADAVITDLPSTALATFR